MHPFKTKIGHLRVNSVSDPLAYEKVKLSQPFLNFRKLPASLFSNFFPRRITRLYKNDEPADAARGHT